MRKQNKGKKEDIEAGMVKIMMNYQIVKLNNRKDLTDRAAEWFHSKWGVPVEAYRERTEDSFKEGAKVPAWYLCLEEDGIIGGMGVIENDFHERKDLTPNICAVYTEEEYRSQGIAGKLLDFVCAEMKEVGIDTLYLVTDHIGFYERYGWEFLCLVQGESSPEPTRMYVHYAYAKDYDKASE